MIRIHELVVVVNVTKGEDVRSEREMREEWRSSLDG